MRRMRLAIALVTAATLVALFVVARPDDDDPASGSPPAPTVTRAEPPEVQPIEPTTETEPEPARPAPVRMTVTIRGGRPVGGIVRADATKGESVVLVVRSDVPDRVHVHGYDRFGDVGPGRPARMQFRASLTGRFEIELEDRHVQIAQLTVVP